ncbi:Fc.00g006280.m01.CDS01 [Cosmosporella sp. VM-42]
MAQSRENPFITSSPHSSSGRADSFKGTPDTRLSAFSPDEGSAGSSKMFKNFARSASATPPVRLPVNSHRGTVSHLDKDPFVSPVHGTRLSPTASTFRPEVNFVDFPFPQDTGPIANALSTDLGLSHHLDVSSSVPLSISEVDSCLADLVEKGAQLYGERQLETVNRHVYVHFSDIRDACSVCSGIRLSKQGWEVSYMSPSQIAKHESEHPDERLRQLGQVLVFAVLRPGTIVDTAQMMEISQRFLQTYGQLFAFVRQTTYMDGSFRAVAQFCNPSDAVTVAKSCNGVSVDGIYLTVTPLNLKQSSVCDLTAALQDVSLTKASSTLDHQQGTCSRVVQRINAPPFSMYPYMFQPPMAPNLPYVLDQVPQAGQIGHTAPMPPSFPIIGHMYQAPPSPALTVHNDFSPSRAVSTYGRGVDARRQNATRVSRSPYHNAAGHHNHVDINRIRDGIDVRTTIMLRNIPNKVDQAMLKRIIDESSWGKYDFMYLRIDFANDCNVGYAFINFVDPLDIIDFVNARGNQRWNCFKSDKVAEISYATIQGKDCLVQKFRNSSVMLEAPHYRPKLYFTSNGPMPELAGQEESFPEPDNQSKMKRSCENAEHVGLFTPNAGQHFRDEQRRRRSQYDRGTRLAALEEYDYEAAIHHLYGPTTQ